MASRPARPRLGVLKFLPVVERELRLASRGRATYRWRTLVVAAGLGLMAMLTVALGSSNTPAEVQGMTLFRTLSSLAALYALVASLAVTADSVSREKREGTLGLLFLTDLRGPDIILGKLAASSLNVVYGLLGLLPLLAIPVMLGGVSIHAGVLATLGVVNLLFVSLSVGILVSVLSWDERRAMFAAIIVMTVLCLGPFVMGGVWVWLRGRGSLAELLFSGISPMFPLLGGSPNWGGGNGRTWSPFLGLIPSHALGWLALVVASVWVSRAWHSRSGAPVRRTVDERVFTAGNPVVRAEHRRQALEVHPLVWLLERHPGKRYYADGLVFSIFLIWVWGYRTYGSDMFGGPTWFLVMPLALTVHFILASWVVAESSMRLLADRRSGALELLLCTSLSDREWIRGHRLALRRLFLRPVILLALAEVYVAFTGFGAVDDLAARNGRWLMLSLATAVVLDTYALSWIALRLAVSLPTVNRVGLLAMAITPAGPALVTLLVYGLTMTVPALGEYRDFHVMLGVWLTLVAVVDGVFGAGWSRAWLRRNFRRAVAEGDSRAAVAG